MSKALTLSGLAVLFAAGALLAGTMGASGQIAETSTEVVTLPSTEPARTVIRTTETVEQTTTRFVSIPTPATTTTTSTTSTAAWVWVLLGILAVGLIVLIVLLARRGRGTVSVDQRRQQLDVAVSSWTAQGWAIENQTADSAVLRRGAETLLVSVDQAGQVSTRPLGV